MKEILHELGINLSYLVAGFLGGVVKVFLSREARPFAMMTFVVTGAITANYVTELLAHYLRFPAGASGFLVGFGATILLPKMTAMMERIDPFRKEESKRERGDNE
jgi:hypothetical protein